MVGDRRRSIDFFVCVPTTRFTHAFSDDERRRFMYLASLQ